MALSNKNRKLSSLTQKTSKTDDRIKKVQAELLKAYPKADRELEQLKLQLESISKSSLANKGQSREARDLMTKLSNQVHFINVKNSEDVKWTLESLRIIDSLTGDVISNKSEQRAVSQQYRTAISALEKVQKNEKKFITKIAPKLKNFTRSTLSVLTGDTPMVMGAFDLLFDGSKKEEKRRKDIAGREKVLSDLLELQARVQQNTPSPKSSNAPKLIRVPNAKKNANVGTSTLPLVTPSPGSPKFVPVNAAANAAAGVGGKFTSMGAGDADIGFQQLTVLKEIKDTFVKFVKYTQAQDDITNDRQEANDKILGAKQENLSRFDSLRKTDKDKILEKDKKKEKEKEKEKDDKKPSLIPSSLSKILSVLKIPGLGKILSGIGRLGRLSKVIPVAGQIIGGVVALYDGIQGWKNADKILGKLNPSYMDKFITSISSMAGGVVGIIDTITGMFGVNTKFGEETTKQVAKAHVIMKDTISSYVNKIADSMARIFGFDDIDHVIDFAQFKMEQFKKAAKGKIDVITQWGSSIFSEFLEGAGIVKDKISGGLTYLKDNAEAKFKEIAKDIEPVFTAFRNVISAAFESLAGKFAQMLGVENFQAVKEKMQAMSRTVTGIADSVSRTANGITSTMKGIMSGSVSTITKTTKKVAEAVGAKDEDFNAYRRAKGGVQQDAPTVTFKAVAKPMPPPVSSGAPTFTPAPAPASPSPNFAKVTPAPEKKSTFVVPTGGAVVSTYGKRKLNGKDDFHPGIDIAATVGTPVNAINSGKVIYAGPAGTLGNAVFIDHGGVQSRYGHLSGINVKTGQSVKPGDMIGAVGMTGYTFGPHLHLETRTGETNKIANSFTTPTDPSAWLGKFSKGDKVKSKISLLGAATQDDNGFPETHTAKSVVLPTASPSLPKATGKSFSPPSAYAQLGEAAAKFESKNAGGSNAISFGLAKAGDLGGVSYGLYQMTSKYTNVDKDGKKNVTEGGTVKNFIDWMNTDERYRPFANMLNKAGGYKAAMEATSGNDAFPKAWKELGQNKAFLDAQHEFIGKTHYEPVKNYADSMGLNTDKRSNAVKQLLFASGVQGTGTAKGYLKSAFGSMTPKEVSGLSDREVIESIEDQKMAGLNRNYGSYNPQVKQSLAARFQEERIHLLEEAGYKRLPLHVQPNTVGADMTAKSIASALNENNRMVQPVVPSPSSTNVVTNNSTTIAANLKVRNNDNAFVRSQDKSFVGI